MPIIFSDANAYQEDLGPSEGEMFFTNLLSGLQKGVEEGGRRKYAEDLRRQELADRLAAEQRQQGYQMAGEGRQQGYQLSAEQRRRDYEQQQLGEQRAYDEEQWRRRGGQTQLDLQRLNYENLQRQAAESKALSPLREAAQRAEFEARTAESEAQKTGIARQQMSDAALADFGGLSEQAAIPYAPSESSVEERWQLAAQAIRDRAASISDPVARNQFMENANKRLMNELGAISERQKIEKEAQLQRRQERAAQAAMAFGKAWTTSGRRVIPQGKDDDMMISAFQTQEDALREQLSSGGLSGAEFADEMQKLASSYFDYTQRMRSLAEREKDRLSREALAKLKERFSGNAKGGDLDFTDEMNFTLPGSTGVRDLNTGEDLLRAADDFLRLPENK